MNNFYDGYNGAKRIDDRWDIEMDNNNRLWLKAIGLTAIVKSKERQLKIDNENIELAKAKENKMFWKWMRDENETEYMKMYPKS